MKNYKSISLSEAELRIVHEFIVNRDYYKKFVEGILKCIFNGFKDNISFDEYNRRVERNINNFMYDFFIGNKHIPHEMFVDITNVKNKIKGDKDE